MVGLESERFCAAILALNPELKEEAVRELNGFGDFVESSGLLRPVVVYPFVERVDSLWVSFYGLPDKESRSLPEQSLLGWLCEKQQANLANVEIPFYLFSADPNCPPVYRGVLSDRERRERVRWRREVSAIATGMPVGMFAHELVAVAHKGYKKVPSSMWDRCWQIDGLGEDH